MLVVSAVHYALCVGYIKTVVHRLSLSHLPEKMHSMWEMWRCLSETMPKLQESNQHQNRTFASPRVPRMHHLHQHCRNSFFYFAFAVLHPSSSTRSASC
jgi:hypothetical protein